MVTLKTKALVATITIFTLSLLVFLYFFVISPNLHTIRTINSQINIFNNAYRQRVYNFDNMEENLNRLALLQDSDTSRIPHSSHLPHIYSELSSLMANHNIIETRFEIGSRSPLYDDTFASDFTIAGRGTYANISDYLHDLQLLPYFIIINRIQLIASDGGQFYVVLDLLIISTN